MTLEKLESLEDNLEKPGFLLFTVTILLFLIIGFVDLIDHTSSSTVVFNKYSIGHVLLMVVYLGITLWWASKLFKPNDDAWLMGPVSWLQQRPYIPLVLFIGFGLLINNILSRENWLNFPALQFVIFVLILSFSGVILFTNRNEPTSNNWWRKLVIYPVAALLIVELVLQGLTFVGALPSLTSATNSFIPYGRIYKTEQRLTNTIANSDGWYYPEFVLAEDSKRIMILGDRSVQGLQVAKEENMGWLLNQAFLEEGNTEVISLGYPDRGPGLYLDTVLLDYAVEAYEPDEIIVMFDFRNDFQTVTRPQRGAIFFEENEEGIIDIHPNSFGVRHHFQHQVIRAYEGFQPNRFIENHYITPRIVSQLLNPPAVQASGNQLDNNNVLGLDNAFVFSAESNDMAMQVAQTQIQTAYEHLQEQGITMRFVTIPVYPKAFYEQNDGNDGWSTQIEDLDLFLPEKTLEAFAVENDIPWLSMGDHMLQTEASVEQIKGFYFGNDGQLTAAGHRYFADAVESCFLNETAVSGCHPSK